MTFDPDDSAVVTRFTGITRDPVTPINYYTRLGTPAAVVGSVAGDWEVLTAPNPAEASDRLRSLSRVGFLWWAKLCLQTSPTGGAAVRKCTVQAKVDRGGTVTVVDETRVGFRGNNDRKEFTLFFGGLQRGDELFFDCIYPGGPAVLSFNTGDVLISSS